MYQRWLSEFVEGIGVAGDQSEDHPDHRQDDDHSTDDDAGLRHACAILARLRDLLISQNANNDGGDPEDESHVEEAANKSDK